MPSEQPGQTAADYVTMVLSPVLIMGLVGSLVFFLLEVFYKTDGPWKERLQWILFFFVFGQVLAARIALRGDISARAPLYGAILAFLTYLGMQWYIEYPEGVKAVSYFVNIFLIGVVWWCANRLTRDCTNIDEDTEVSGEGLLQAAGLEEAPQQAEPEDNSKLSWLERYRRYRDKRKRTLGVWVVYFSLGALPIFGLGQALIPLTSPERRLVTFWLTMVYVACGLGLLLTSCFLGLRQYLRQKRVQMPPAMTATWLLSGAAFIFVLLMLALFLPRPYPELPLTDYFGQVDSAKRSASRFAVKGDAPGEGEGRPGEARPDGKQGGKVGEKGEGQAKGDKDGKGSGKDGQSKGGGNDKDRSQSKQGERDGKSSKGEKQGQGKNAEQAKGMKEMQEAEKNASSKSSSSSSSAMQSVQQFLQRLGPILKWIVFGVLALLVLIALLRGGLGFLANFTDWARKLLDSWRNFWANLFTRKQQEDSETDEEEDEKEAIRNQPFSAFANPFDSGKAEEMSPADLVRYSFAALQAWARERGVGRREDETAMEWAARLGEELPAMETVAKRLSQMHGRVEYGKGGAPAGAELAAREAWAKMERATSAPLSA